MAKDGSVTLSGTVENAAAYTAAVETAFSAAPGPVTNALKIRNPAGRAAPSK